MMVFAAASQRLAVAGARAWSTSAASGRFGRAIRAAPVAAATAPMSVFARHLPAAAVPAAWGGGLPAPFAPSSVRVRRGSVMGNELKKGGLIKVDGAICRVLDKGTVKSGKGNIYVQAEIVNVKTGVRIVKRFRSQGEKIETVELDSNDSYQLLEKSDTALTLMHTTNFEQISIDPSVVPEGILFEGMVLQIAFAAGEVRTRALEPVVCASDCLPGGLESALAGTQLENGGSRACVPDTPFFTHSTIGMKACFAVHEEESNCVCLCAAFLGRILATITLLASAFSAAAAAGTAGDSPASAGPAAGVRGAHH
jgi:translation elongation factor P/translation initiation factor 5A